MPPPFPSNRFGPVMLTSVMPPIRQMGTSTHTTNPPMTAAIITPFRFFRGLAPSLPAVELEFAAVVEAGLAGLSDMDAAESV